MREVINNEAYFQKKEDGVVDDTIRNPVALSGRGGIGLLPLYASTPLRMIATLLLLMVATTAIAAARRAWRQSVGPPLRASTVATGAHRLPRPPPPTQAAQRACNAGLVNVRDVGAAAPPGATRRGALFRCASPLALPPHAARTALAALVGGCGEGSTSLPPIVIIDLRSASEWEAGGAATAAALRVSHAWPPLPTPASITVHRAPLQEWGPFTRAFVLRLPVRKAAPIVASFLHARVRRLRPPVPALRAAVLAAINEGGLPATYATILGAAGHRVAAALRGVSAAAAARALTIITCKHGKDRSGLVAALVLAILEVDRGAVLADYAASAEHCAAAAISLPGLRGAPPAALATVWDWLDAEWGGVDGYLDWIGFGAAERDALRRALK